MAREDENYDILPIPLNSKFDFNFLGLTFQMRKAFEGIALGLLGFLISYLIVRNIKMQIGVALTIMLFLTLGGLLLGGMGVNNDYVSNAIINIFTFYRKKRITFYNPRVKKEQRFFVEELQDEDDYVIPRERLEALYHKYINKKEIENAQDNFQDEEFDENYMYFEDDIDVLGKPRELMSERELKKLERLKKKEERKRKRLARRMMKNGREKERKKKIAGI